MHSQMSRPHELLQAAAAEQGVLCNRDPDLPTLQTNVRKHR